MAGRPNVVLFLTDDHGQWAAGCYGNRELVTPSLDWLAATGVRCTAAFTPTPVCSPARASLFTGLLASQHGIHDWLRESEEARGHPGLAGLDTLGTALSRAGYHTALVGKWHCGRCWEPQPGFARWFSYQVAQYPHFGEQRFVDGGHPVAARGFQSVLLTEQAVRVLRERPDGAPLFLAVGYVNTHTPHRDQPERWVARYRRCSFADIPDEVAAPCHGLARMAWPHAPEARREELAQYYAAVSAIDEQVGRVLDELAAQGVLDDTLVIYTSDHGHMNGHHGLHTKGNATVPQNFLEESIRVPLLARWPGGGVAGGRTCPVLADHCDLFATVLDAAGGGGAAGAGRPEGWVGADGLPRPGRSLLPALRGEAVPWREAQFCEYGNARMIRTERFKFIRRYPGPNGSFPDELYDLQADPRERANVGALDRYGEVRAHLAARLDEHFAAYEVPARSGREIARQPACNPAEPWRQSPV